MDKFLLPEEDIKKRRKAKSKRSKYPTPRYFIPVNPQKYVGNANAIVARSNLERRFFKIFDMNNNVLQWGSEEMHIKYLSSVDGKVHRYFPDVVLKLKDRTGKTKIYVIEIKCKAQCNPPKKRNSQKYLTEMVTYQTNQDKWQAAKTFCEKRGLIFYVLTEEHLGGF
jgi:hypothetical protein